MGDVNRRDEASDRLAESVRHALRLVGPAEQGLESLSDDGELSAA